jgi:8-oxo-dGTP pyrophosphatase MutT (NUDIX family)
VPVTNNAVLGAALAYIQANPDELDVVRPLVVLAMQGPSVTLRSTTPAHVTCRAVAVSPDRHVLEVRPQTGDWQLPGGHLTPSDSSLLGAALRGLGEAAGIVMNTVIPDAVVPFDLDAHVAVAAPDRGEPEHVHYEVRFLLYVADRAVRLPVGNSHRWVPIAALGGRLGAKLARSGATRNTKAEATGTLGP